MPVFNSLRYLLVEGGIQNLKLECIHTMLSSNFVMVSLHVEMEDINKLISMYKTAELAPGKTTIASLLHKNNIKLRERFMPLLSNVLLFKATNTVTNYTVVIKMLRPESKKEIQFCDGSILPLVQ